MLTLKYFAKSIEQIENGHGSWNSLHIGIFERTFVAEKGYDGEQQIGSYIFNYSTFCGQFAPFKVGDQWYALYSKDYTRTSLMTLPDCKDIGGEESYHNGFCPFEYYIPMYYSDGEFNYVVENDAELNGKSENDLHFFPYAFVSGCVWGDDWSSKVEVIDLSHATEGKIIRNASFGYYWLPFNKQLAESIKIDDFEVNEDLNSVEVAIDTNFRFFMGYDYSHYSLENNAPNSRTRIKPNPLSIPFDQLLKDQPQELNQALTVFSDAVNFALAQLINSRDKPWTLNELHDHTKMEKDVIEQRLTVLELHGIIEVYTLVDTDLQYELTHFGVNLLIHMVRIYNDYYGQYYRSNARVHLTHKKIYFRTCEEEPHRAAEDQRLSMLYALENLLTESGQYHADPLSPFHRNPLHIFREKLAAIIDHYKCKEN